MLRSFLVLSVLLVGSSVAAADEPEITWDSTSPTVLAGPRIFAAGSYSLPASGGGVSWSLDRIEFQWKMSSASGWAYTNATVDSSTKTWQHTTLIQPAATYNVRAKMYVTKRSAGMPPVVQNFEYATVEKTVVLP